MKVFKSPLTLSFLAYSSFSFMDVINKFLFSQYAVGFFEYMLLLDLAIIFFIIMIGYYSSKKSFRFLYTKNIKGITIRSIVSVINTLCSLVAISTLPFHLFYSLIFLQPFFATILAVIFALEKINFKKILLVILGFCGILISIEFWSNDFDHLNIWGLVAGAGIALSGAISGIVVKKYLKNENTTTIGTYNILLSIIVACLYLIVQKENPFVNLSTNFIALILGAGLFCSLGILLFMKSYQNGYVQSISILQYIQLVWGVGFGYFLFNSIPSVYATIGAFIIILANILNIYMAKNE